MSDSYQTGWSDGYAEGYGCKLADATEPFVPTLQVRPEEVTLVANWLMKTRPTQFRGMDEAIGLARGMLEVASGLRSSPQSNVAELLSIAKRWSALDAGNWHIERYERERTELLVDTRAAIAKATP